MDGKLLFDKHINNSINKVKGLTRSLYTMINRRSSLQLANKLLLYKSVFRPVLTYGCPVWQCCAMSHLRRLQVKQNKLLKMIFNLDPWFPTDELHDIAETETLLEFFNKLTNKFKLSCEISTNPLVVSLFQ